MTQKINYKILFLVFLLTILLSSWPNFHPEEHLGLSYHWALDILFHSSYYFAITFILALFFSANTKLYWIYIVVLGTSIVLEIAQQWIPQRTSSWLDILSNVIGTTTGLGTFILFEKIYLSFKKHK